MSTDVYSSTDEYEPSSDDHSSINSVIFVENVRTDPDSDLGDSGREEGRDSASPGLVPLPPLRDPRQSAESDHPHDSSSDSETSISDRNNDSDSSSSSDGTQVWVPAQKGSSSSSVPSSTKVGLRGSVIHNNSMMMSMRNSIVSQNSNTGKVETCIISEETPFNGDSGISNESPETHSSAEHHLHLAPHGLRTGPHSHIISLPTLSSTSPPASPQVGKQRGADDNRDENHPITNQAEMDAHIRESLFNILSGLYCLFLIVMGAALPIAEIFAEPVTPGVFEMFTSATNRSSFEGFYIYLFGVSVAFLLYVYVFLLRARTIARKCWREKGTNHDSLLRKARRGLVSVTNRTHTGSFYLRLGAVGFGIGAMIHEGLIFGGLFEMDLGGPCTNLSEAVRPVLHLAFTFIQLYFIFLNSKMCIHRYKVFARFGLMHMIATNICVWLHTVVMETIREIREHVHDPQNPHQGMMHLLSHVALQTNATTPKPSPRPPAYAVVPGVEDIHSHNLTGNDTHVNPSPTAPPIDCRREDIMRNVVDAASPYLYPCTIQYSLVATGILYVMWRNIGHMSSRGSSRDRAAADKNKKNHIHVDCSGANRGLFFGIFLLVAAIISMIVFFVLVERPQYVESAILVVHVSEVVLYTLALVAVCVAAYKIRDMRFQSDKDNSLDESLLLVALTGQFIFCVFCVMAGHYNTDTYGGSLVMTTSMLIMLEAILQTVFILNGLRRSPLKPYHETKKPGREYVTFLLVCNIGMWGINTFEVLRSDSNPIALNFYGLLLWNIITHVSTPLVIFYRFHSTVCLANIWKNAYKQKLH